MTTINIPPPTDLPAPPSAGPRVPAEAAPAEPVRRPRWHGVTLCLVSATGFGVAAIFAKESYRAGGNVPTMLLVRFALAAAVLWVVVGYRRPAWPAPRALLTCVGLGAVGYAAQAACFFGSVARIDASLSSLLLYLYPTLVMVLAVALRRERPDRRRIAALACSAGGLLLLLGTGGMGSAAATGVLLALGAAVVYAGYLTIADGLPADLDLYLMSAVVCTSAAVSLTVFGVATGSFHAPERPAGWAWNAMLAIFSTVIPVACMFAGVRLVGAPTAAILSCAEPAVTVASTALVYGERLTAGQAVGGLAVVAAVAVLQTGGSRRRTAARSDGADHPSGVLAGGLVRLPWRSGRPPRP